MVSIKHSVIALFAAAAALAGGVAQAQAYPSKPVRFVVTYPAGGSSDAMARIIGVKLTEYWGQQVLLNRGRAQPALLAWNMPPSRRRMATLFCSATSGR